MDGLVLSVALWFRSYAGDGLTEWIAIGIAGVSLGVMFWFTRLVYLNFKRDTKDRNSVIAKNTLEPVRRLDELLNDPSLKELKEGAYEIRRIHHSFVVNRTPLKEDDYDFFAAKHKIALAFLEELEITNYQVKYEVISKDFLIFTTKGRILPEYNSFFRPLVEITVAIGERLPMDDPQKKLYEGVWGGVQELIKEMETATPQNKF